MTISLEELEQDIIIKNPRTSFENLAANIQIDNLNNLVNIKKKQKKESKL